MYLFRWLFFLFVSDVHALAHRMPEKVNVEIMEKWWTREISKQSPATGQSGPVGDWTKSERLSPEDAFKKSDVIDDIPGQSSKKEKSSREGLTSRRKLGWFNRYKVEDPYEEKVYTFNSDPYEQFDEWSIGWRMLGGYIDCTIKMNYDGDGGGGGDDGQGCDRYIIWAAYYNPYYSGMEYYEYASFDDDYRQNYKDQAVHDDAYGGSHTSQLDCHDDNSAWELVGVYRLDIGTFIEQLTKHVWAYDQWQYTAVYAASNYFGDGECEKIGQDQQGNYLYGALRPISGGYFMMGVYMDYNCLMPTDDYDYDELTGGGYSNNNNGQGDNKYQYVDDDYFGNQKQMWKLNAKESSLQMFNDALDTYRYCTPCVDYPSYQDGAQDDGINQCWKFYSHGAYNCRGSCLKIAAMQGSITNIRYGSYVFKGDGKQMSYNSKKSGGGSVSHFEQILSSFLLCVSGILFFGTLLSFCTTRGTYTREVGDSKSTTLINNLDEGEYSGNMSRPLRPLDLYDRFFRKNNANRGEADNLGMSVSEGQSTDYSEAPSPQDSESEMDAMAPPPRRLSPSRNSSSPQMRSRSRSPLRSRSPVRRSSERPQSRNRIRSGSPARSSSPVRSGSPGNRGSPLRRNFQNTESDLGYSDNFGRHSPRRQRSRGRHDETDDSDSSPTYHPAANSYQNKADRLRNLRAGWN
uniref:Uncharacterized protein n=1 Tax=Corethron hystrix TaxID=216773 RepID=A0A7S1G2Q6_9STRA|mmetsp:Transcript_9055/g.20024  ORF Transcript_9055/g.20024 Transcript_9055/m.20024 type:complete len:687 (+) Transcript_9055:332-2392(+)